MYNLTKKNSFRYFLLTFAILFAVASHIIGPSPGGTGLYLYPNMISWIFIAVLIFIGINLARMKGKMILPKTVSIIFIGYLCLLLPLFYGGDYVGDAIPRLLGILAGGLLLLVLFQFRSLKWGRYCLLFILSIGMFIESLIGVLQYILMNMGDVYIDTFYYPSSGRLPVSSFQQPNILASYMASGIALSLFLWPKIKVSLLKQYHNGFFCLSLFLASFLIIVIQGKVGLLAGIIVITCQIPLFISKASTYKKPLLSIFMGILVGVSSSSLLSSSSDGSFSIPENTYKDDGARIAIYQVSFDMIKNKPLIGYGYGEFERQYLENHVQRMSQDEDFFRMSDGLNHPHNEILFWQIEGGIIATIGILIFIYAYLRLLLKGSFNYKKLTLLSLIIPLSLHTLTEFPFYQSLLHWITFIVIFWFTVEELKGSSEKKTYNVSINKNLTVAICVGVILYMCSVMHTAYWFAQYRTVKKDAQYLDKIINEYPWRLQVDYTRHTHNLEVGIKTDNVELLNNYLIWGYKFTKKSPRFKIYKNMIQILQIFEKNNIRVNQQMAKAIVTDALRLYPKDVAKS